LHSVGADASIACMPAFSADDGTVLAYHVLGDGEPLLCVPGGPMRVSPTSVISAGFRGIGS
jgi:hypothetical protein